MYYIIENIKKISLPITNKAQMFMQIRCMFKFVKNA